ncbi:hypothetical protein QSJ19_11415 [Gordonia sp. ABSL11-1]|uniref:hypothetical protein n=1 Tax=Gordonia sp. ABSL11-1 TaxID=3053924 RepID=UPI002572CFE4|nr:hypothetical protein [Gordonia sp. ABSL11-1]MDL9946194.1 hypothetical protein [Gordonia sp. ABSL11-1]
MDQGEVDVPGTQIPQQWLRTRRQKARRDLRMRGGQLREEPVAYGRDTSGAIPDDRLSRRPRDCPADGIGEVSTRSRMSTARGCGRGRRAEEGRSYRVHVSLTRAALWIVGMGIFDKDYATHTAGRRRATSTVMSISHVYLDPETFTADTPLGRYQGVTEQVYMSATPEWSTGRR